MGRHVGDAHHPPAAGDADRGDGRRGRRRDWRGGRMEGRRPRPGRSRSRHLRRLRRAAAAARLVRGSGSGPGPPARLLARRRSRHRSPRGHRALSRGRERSRVPAPRAPRAAGRDVPPGRVPRGGRRAKRRRQKVQSRPAAERRVRARARDTRVRHAGRAQHPILLPRLRHAPRRVARAALPARSPGRDAGGGDEPGPGG